jgi:uncharacterized protein (TIGR02466 family)
MEKFNLFKADLFLERDVGTDEQYNDLLRQIRFFQKNNINPAPYSNENCWRTESKYENIDWIIQSLKKLLSEFISEYKYELESKNLDYNKISYFYWTNVNGPRSRNARHAHVKSHFSAVYYVQGQDTGSLRLINPANSLSECNPSAPYISDIVYPPKDRDLIMWPAWVPHEVDPNYSERERINVVFDIVIGPK